LAEALAELIAKLEHVREDSERRLHEERSQAAERAAGAAAREAALEERLCGSTAALEDARRGEQQALARCQEAERSLRSARDQLEVLPLLWAEPTQDCLPRRTLMCLA
jgi:hypothetical protein